MAVCGGVCYVVVGVLRGRTWPVASVGVDPGGTLRGVLVYDVECLIKSYQVESYQDMKTA